MLIRTPALLAALATSALLCGTSPAQPKPPSPADRPIALISNRTLTWPDLGPLLAEASGGQILEEYALGLILKDETDKRSIPIGDKEIQAERQLLADMLTSAARVPASESETLIASIRRSRGLGDLRFRALLERNAALRALVRAGVGDQPITITNEDLDTAYALKYGPRLKARLILVRTQTTATTAAKRLAAGEPFNELAAELSLDPSASRGGLLDPFSPQDPSYPIAVRKTLETLKPGQTSDPIAVTWGEGGSGASPSAPGADAQAGAGESGFAIVKLESTLPESSNAPTRQSAAKDLDREVRTVRERAQMDKLAHQYLRNAAITPMDPALNWSWQQRTGGK